MRFRKRYIPALLAFALGFTLLYFQKIAVLIVSGLSFAFGFFYLVMVRNLTRASRLFYKYKKMYQDGEANNASYWAQNNHAQEADSSQHATIEVFPIRGRAAPEKNRDLRP